jgi:hypothetical protein
MKTESEIVEMSELLDGFDSAFQGTFALDYVGAPTREQLHAYITALEWVLGLDSYIPGHVNVLTGILSGHAEPLLDDALLEDEPLPPTVADFVHAAHQHLNDAERAELKERLILNGHAPEPPPKETA